MCVHQVLWQIKLKILTFRKNVFSPSNKNVYLSEDLQKKKFSFSNSKENRFKSNLTTGVGTLIIKSLMFIESFRDIFKEEKGFQFSSKISFCDAFSKVLKDF